MKNILLASLFIFLFAELKISSAQTYHPFPDTLAKWSEISFMGGEISYPFCTQGWIFTTATDTIINGQMYTTIGFDSTFYRYYWYNGTNITIENYAYLLPGEIIGAIREDSDRKIWFRRFLDATLDRCLTFTIDSLPLDSDILIYDFGVQIGDTLTWKSYNKVIDVIDSIQLLNGEWRRRISFNTMDFWVEGIGSSLGLFGAYETPPEEIGYQLYCFRENDVLLYPTGFFDYDCDHFSTSLTQPLMGESAFTYPNPAFDYVIFNFNNFSGSQCDISIYNSTGQFLRHFSSVHSNQIQIPIEEIGNDGMYFYTLKSGDEKLFAGKFLIQR